MNWQKIPTGSISMLQLPCCNFHAATSRTSATASVLHPAVNDLLGSCTMQAMGKPTRHLHPGI